MGQAVSIMDSYAYRSLVWGIYVERIDRPQRGLASDLQKVEAARRLATICLSALERLAPTSDWNVDTRKEDKEPGDEPEQREYSSPACYLHEFEEQASGTDQTRKVPEPAPDSGA